MGEALADHIARKRPFEAQWQAAPRSLEPKEAFEILRELYRKAGSRNKELSKDEGDVLSPTGVTQRRLNKRAHLLPRGDIVVKALSCPESLTQTESTKSCTEQSSKNFMRPYVESVSKPFSDAGKSTRQPEITLN
jgi:hypothetical protein